MGVPISPNDREPAPADVLSAPVASLRGVGREREAQLERLHIRTVYDVLLHRPRRYEDRRHSLSIQSLKLDTPGTIRGVVRAMGVRRLRRGSKSVFELMVEDATGRVTCRWWNMAFMQSYFRVGDDVFVYGKPATLRPICIDHPEVEVIESGVEASVHLNRIVPVYRLTEGLPQRWLRHFLWQRVAEYAAVVPEPWIGLERPGEITRAEAIRRIHFPESMDEAEQGRRRLATDEFIALQLELRRRRRSLEANAKGLPCAGDNRFIKPFLKKLGFTLTDGQTSVLREIRHDLGAAHPMRRLLQGDVGCGKTVVAACSALMALESGFSVALMAPTEILAEQHFHHFQSWCEGLPIRLAMQTGNQKSRGESAGLPTLYIGTHALIQERFSMERLGMVIIDEQHKFGVEQREVLLKKGHFPHLLIMTATPIPRTLGLTLYGDLDVSVIQQMPRGRGELKTFVRGVDRLPRVWEFVKQKLQEGRQAYLVYPRIEEGGKPGLKSLNQELERIRKALAPYTVGWVHGKLSAEEKQASIEGFRTGKVQVLLATTVIEVGVDVPNASVMVIESAEQFGLAQLHQLRGRIGRGSHESFCILVGDLESGEARDRLEIMERTRDGFEIAEADMRLRGPGELIGKDQSGLPDFKFADLRTDLALVNQARGLADIILDGRGEVRRR